MPDASFLKLGMGYPLPSEMIRRFAAGVERLIVVEELDPFLEEIVRAMGIPVEGKRYFSAHRRALGGARPVGSAGCGAGRAGSCFAAGHVGRRRSLQPSQPKRQRNEARASSSAAPASGALPGLPPLPVPSSR